MRTLLIFCLFALMVVPAAHAALVPEPTARQIQAMDFAAVAVDGFLRVGNETFEASQPLTGFSLEAESVRVERQTWDEPRVTGVLGASHLNPRVTFEDHERPVLIETDARSHRFVEVMTLPGASVRVQGDLGTVTTPPKPTIQFSDADGGDNQPKNISTDGAVLLAPGLNPVITVTGDFVVALWEVDLELHDASGDSHEVHAGYRPSDTVVDLTGVGPLPARGVGVYHGTEVVLHVTGGVLHLNPTLEAAQRIGSGPLGPAKVMESAILILHQPDLHASTLRINGVSGLLPPVLGGVEARGNLLVRGDLDLALGAPRPSQALPWSLSGRIDLATLDGEPLTLQVPTAGHPETRFLLPLLAPLLLLGIAATGFPLRARSARRRLRDAELLFSAGHFEAAAHAAGTVRTTRLAPQATALRVQALLHAGHVQEARRLAEAGTLDRAEPILRRLTVCTVRDWEGTP